MASQAQIQANRSNAQKSTGPRTPAGKAVVSQNAVKHGLLARHAVIAGEDPGQFETYRDQMLAELNPEGSVESMLAHRAVGLAWRLLRAERLQNEAFDHLYTDETTNPLRNLTRRYLQGGKAEPAPEPGSDLTLGRTVVKDFANTRVLDRLLMYERRLEHSLYRTTAELQRLRLLRQLTPPQESTVTAPDQPVLSEAERNTAPSLPHRAKQTQFPTAPTAPNHLPKRSLRPKAPIAPPQKQTQFAAHMESHRGTRSRKNRCENTAPRLIVRADAPLAPLAKGNDPKAVQTKGELA